MTNPQQNALAEALERIASMGDSGGGTGGGYRAVQIARQALASNNPAAAEGQGEARETILAVLQREIVGGDGGTEESFDFIEGIADALIAALAPAPGQWDNSYHSERTDAVLARMASQHTELAGEAIEVICLLRHEQDRLRNENLTLGARVLDLEGADREGV